MATLSNTALTLIDWAKRRDPDGSVPVIAELLSQTNEVLEDMLIKEGNIPTGERVVIRTGLPSVYYRMLNQGIPSSKSTTATIDEATAMLEARCETDVDLASLNNDKAELLLSEDRAFLEAMNQEQCSALFYGNPQTDPKKYLGLAARYSDLSAGNATNIIDAGGTGSDLASVYLVCWGSDTAYGIFPKGSNAGLETKDLGEVTVYDGDNRMQAYARIHKWKHGLVVKDWRYVVRIANIDISDLQGVTGTQATSSTTQLTRLMNTALYKLPNPNMGKCAFYMNRSVHAGLANLALEKSNNVLAIESGLNQFGQPTNWTSFQGLPLRNVDALNVSETRVT